MEEATPAPVRARVTRLQAGIAGLACLFVLLSVLVAAGRLDSLDQHAVAHWMPNFDPVDADRTIPPATGIFMPIDLDSSWWKQLLELAMYPASVLISIALFGLGSLVLWRRGSRVAAVVWGSSWFVANALEVLAKVAIEKPALERTADGVAYHVAAFDHSFPSGHAMRAVLVAGLVACVWPRLRGVALGWVAVISVCLVASSWHVPSDVAGGLCFGLLAVLVTHAANGALSARRA